jgi:enamine deaminase RidA (YjgF/YER057c/UK114 family)
MCIVGSTSAADETRYSFAMTQHFRNPPGLSTPTGYSHVAILQAGRQLHVSGQVALDATGAIVGRGDLRAQAEQVYRNIAIALEAAGASLREVRKAVIYVVDLNAEKAAVLREVRKGLWGEGPFPASTMVGVTALVHPDWLLEIEVIAAG